MSVAHDNPAATSSALLPPLTESVRRAAVALRHTERAARVVLTDEAGRVLLFRYAPADRPPFWCAPGGSILTGPAPA